MYASILFDATYIYTYESFYQDRAICKKVKLVQVCDKSMCTFEKFRIGLGDRYWHLYMLACFILYNTYSYSKPTNSLYNFDYVTNFGFL